MGINLDDPRVRKTRRGLQEALVRLILREGYDNLSVQAIADEAQTARITFYRHYHDKKDLLADCLNTLYEELTQKTGAITREGLLAGYTPVHVLYEHITQQEALYRILFASGGTHTVLERLRHHMAQKGLEAMQRLGRIPAGGIPMELVAYHAASAQLGLAIWWLDHGKPYPTTYMASLSLWLTLSGVARALGNPDFTMPIPAPP